MLSLAVEAMMENQDELRGLEGDRLLSPTRIQGALALVSHDRVDELVKEEYAWLEPFIKSINGQSMLMERSVFLRHLDINLWKNREQRAALPGDTPGELLEVLKKLGIITVASDGRINVPDIYLYGLNLRRSGGIKRPKSL